MTVFGDGPIAIPHADVRFDGARLENGAEETYTGVKLGVLGELSRYDTKVTKGLGILSLITARVDLDARMPSGAAWLNVYLRNAPGSGSPEGSPLGATLGGRRKVVPGGFVEVAPHDLEAGFAGFSARGRRESASTSSPRRRAPTPGSSSRSTATT